MKFMSISHSRSEAVPKLHTDCATTCVGHVRQLIHTISLPQSTGITSIILQVNFSIMRQHPDLIYDEPMFSPCEKYHQNMYYGPANFYRSSSSEDQYYTGINMNTQRHNQNVIRLLL